MIWFDAGQTHAFPARFNIKLTLQTHTLRTGSKWAFRKQVGATEVVLLADTVKEPADGFTLFAIDVAGPEMLALGTLSGVMHNVLRTFSTVPTGHMHTPPSTAWLDIAQMHWPAVSTKPTLH